MNPSPNCARTTSTTVLLARLAKQVMRRCSSDLLGIDLRLLMALSYVADHDGAPQQELVEAFWMDAKNVVLLLNELEDAGFLVRRRDAEDRRRHRVYMTEAGRQTLERAAQAQEQTEEEVLRALDPAERATLRELLIRAVHDAEPAPSAERAAVPACS